MSGGGGEVLEGFLCPLCMKDLGDVIQLQVARLYLSLSGLIDINPVSVAF